MCSFIPAAELPMDLACAAADLNGNQTRLEVPKFQGLGNPK